MTPLVPCLPCLVLRYIVIVSCCDTAPPPRLRFLLQLQ